MPCKFSKAVLYLSRVYTYFCILSRCLPGWLGTTAIRHYFQLKLPGLYHSIDSPDYPKRLDKCKILVHLIINEFAIFSLFLQVGKQRRKGKERKRGCMHS